jgi:hypothetical protein
MRGIATIAGQFLGHELGNRAVVTGAMDDYPAVGVRVSGIDYHCV